MSDPQRLWPLRLLAVWPSSTATPVAARGQRCRLGLHRPSQELLELLPSISDSCSYVAIQNKTSRQSQRKKVSCRNFSFYPTIKHLASTICIF
ncbi:hypothetical protein OsJ_33736 [Oryza sativa Japonica Group]|uniref:Secreted protein n=1 Tax=Oryza sativa subsp. japonica TaxID=39947 RepID=B9GAG3_ORYSJ|nr:hypothetical protein OsJ_33736 [Oryza sativa Japonica Group]